MGIAPASSSPYRFCPVCGGELEQRLLPNDDRPRLVCHRCARVLYLDPKVVVNVILERGGRLLLLRRAIEPRYGAWTMPGGYMELGETAEEAAVRETVEEAGLTPRLGRLLGVYSRPDPGILVVVYKARAGRGRVVCSHETLEGRWFAPGDVPWEELAFPTTRRALEEWLRQKDRRRAGA